MIKIIIDDSIPKDTIYMIPDNLYIHQITCIEKIENGYNYTYKLYPILINKRNNKK